MADVLFGRANLTGRLPITRPMAEGQVPLICNHKPTGRGDDCLDLSGRPLFPFGFDLNYTSLVSSGLRTEPGVISPSGKATIRHTVRNAGAKAGDHAVQLRLRDELASVVRPVTELAAFERVHLEPGQSADVAFDVGQGLLRPLDERKRRVVEPGAFRVMIGGRPKASRPRGELTVRQRSGRGRRRARGSRRW